MVAHQAKCVDAVANPLDSFLGKKVKPGPILIIAENNLVGVAPQEDLIYCARIMKS